MRLRRTPPVIDGMPVLSAGRHRRPSSGACVMEYVSVLAGERWSDHPQCVDPPLAALARAVNDRLSHAARQQLALRAPDFIGTDHAGDRERVAAAAGALSRALVGLSERADPFVILVALDALQRWARVLGVDDVSGLADAAARAARARPSARSRAAEFVDGLRVGSEGYLREGLPAALTTAVGRVAESGVNPDAALLAMLDAALEAYAAARPADASAPVASEPLARVTVPPPRVERPTLG